MRELKGRTIQVARKEYASCTLQLHNQQQQPTVPKPPHFVNANGLFQNQQPRLSTLPSWSNKAQAVLSNWRQHWISRWISRSKQTRMQSGPSLVLRRPGC